MPKHLSDKEAKRLYIKAMNYAIKHRVNQRAACKATGISQHIITRAQRTIPDLPPWPFGRKLKKEYTEEEFKAIYDKAKEIYLTSTLDVVGALREVGTSRKTFLNLIEKFDLPDIVGLKPRLSPEDFINEESRLYKEAVIQPDLYALAAMAVGGFAKGFGFERNEILNKWGKA